MTLSACEKDEVWFTSQVQHCWRQVKRKKRKKEQTIMLYLEAWYMSLTPGTPSMFDQWHLLYSVRTSSHICCPDSLSCFEPIFTLIMSKWKIKCQCGHGKTKYIIFRKEWTRRMQWNWRRCCLLSYFLPLYVAMKRSVYTDRALCFHFSLQTNRLRMSLNLCDKQYTEDFSRMSRFWNQGRFRSVMDQLWVKDGYCLFWVFYRFFLQL